MPRTADLVKNHNEFEVVMRQYRDFIGRILSARNVIKTAADKREIVESCLLRICAHWEAFVVEELIDCANVDASRLATFAGVQLPKLLATPRL